MLVAWLAFVALVLLMLAIDLGVFHRRPHEVSVREALGWSAVWLTLGLGFSGIVYVAYEHHWVGLGLQVDSVDGSPNTGITAVEKYLTGYVVEKSLSIDNIFVIAMIFAALGIPAVHQHRVLFWGVIGAVAMRAVMILLGAALIARFHWLLWVFAGLLLVTGIRLLVSRDTDHDPGRGSLLRLIRRWCRVTDGLVGQRFLVRQPAVGLAGASWALTPLAVALILVEGADLVFAVDSIPAIFAIPGDPFLVFTSNVFAMLGLRSLFFALAGAVRTFRYLKPALAVVLIVVGCKMLAAEPLKANLGSHFNLWLLAVVLGIVGAGILLSVRAERIERRGWAGRAAMPRVGNGA